MHAPHWKVGDRQSACRLHTEDMQIASRLLQKSAKLKSVNRSITPSFNNFTVLRRYAQRLCKSTQEFMECSLSNNYVFRESW